MHLSFTPATQADIDNLYQLNKALIDTYEAIETIDYDRVLQWVRRKLENSIGEYSAVYSGSEKVGYYHFCRTDGGEYELDDLYILPEHQNHGIGTAIIEQCCASVNAPVTLYVFIRNERAVALYRRLGFEITSTVHGSRYIMKRDCRKYYAAYEERYKTAHAHGVSWASDRATPIVMETIAKYNISHHQALLEIGCGEGRDSRAVLDSGYSLLSTDISPEAIAYCQHAMPQHADHFRVLDCLSDTLDGTFDFIFAVAVVHMLVLDEDRRKFYQFIRHHLTESGLALICTMGDGTQEMQSDISTAFTLQERHHESGPMLVAGTSCRMVSFPTFERELAEAGLVILEKGMTAAPPDFDRLMFAVVGRNRMDGRG